MSLFRPPASFFRVALTALPLLALVLAAPAAYAQANLTFSGGSGTPLIITFLNPVSYTVTSATTAVDFIIKGIGPNAFGNNTGTSTLTYRVNGGAPLAIANFVTGNFTGDINDNDGYFFGRNTNLAINDTVTFSAGTFRTTNSFTGARPANGSYVTFIADGANGDTRSSTNGIAVTAAAPEPGSIALLLGAGVSVAVLVCRRKKASATS